MWGALIPDGPLHPDDAIAAVLVGLAVGLIARFTTAGPLLVVAAAGLTLEWRHDGMLVDGVLDRPSPLWAMLGVLVVAIVIATIAVPLAERSMRAAGLVALAPVGVVWGLVADTEPAVIGGAVLTGAVIAGLGRSGRLVAATALVAPMAALVGSYGRPSQLTLALGAAVVWAVGARIAAEIAFAARRRLDQRAGTPMTVEPGSTSSITTAPAATTAP